MAETTTDAKQQDFTNDPSGHAKRWQMELDASKKWLHKWHERGEKVLAAFKCDKRGEDDSKARWPYFTSNIQTQKALLYGQVPSVSVDRRWADATDDVARVGAEILERLLNSDIEKDSDSYAEALGYALEDRMLPGLGIVRVRYVAEFGVTQPEQPPKVDQATGAELAPAVPAIEGKTYECVDADYVHWKDVRFSPCRVFHEMRWLAFRSEMSREDIAKRFGDALAKRVPMNAKKAKSNDTEDTAQASDPWQRAEVWEIWSKEDRKVYWYVEGINQTLDEKDDPLKLDGFWPVPKPMLANCTTDAMIPTPDYGLAKDIYDELDTVRTRITLLERAIRVAGVYDKTSAEVQRLVSEAGNNELIPVERWAMFAEKGGVKGCIDWLPLDQIVNALAVLRDYARELVDSLFQLTGMSDIMRGQATQAAATATEQRIKAQFGSVRMQALQDEFARFASGVQRLKAEIIAKHFDPQTILTRANVQFMPQADQQIAQQAVQLIKSGGAVYRVEVKPESVSMADFAAMQQESMAVLGGLSQFFTAAAPLAQQSPATTPYLLQMLQWAMSRVRGASSMEGILDQAIAAAQQAAQQAQQNPQQQAPDPKLQTQMLKGQQDIQKIQAELKADIVREQNKVQADAQREQDQALWNTREAAMRQQISDASRAAHPESTKSGGVR